jgi:hypothetical protein
MSNPILVSGSGPAPMMHPVGSGTRPAPKQQPKVTEGTSLKTADIPEGNPVDRSALGATATASVAALLRQLGELHGQMLTQFEQSLGLMVRLFACLGPEQLPAMQQELALIQELNSELGHLQVELARRATDKPSPQTPPARTVTTPSAQPAPDSTTLHDWVADRISSLQRERQARWQSLVGMFSATETR